jgi:oligopeptide transport system substrate-binding protein
VTLDKDLNPVKDIADSWKISPDGKTYTFSLRQDVKFQNGKAVTAQDFKYSWERACSLATGSSTAATYLGDIAGVREMLSGQANQISGVTVIDNYTLEVNIVESKSYFIFKLTYPVAFVVDSQNVQSGAEWWRKPNGTGPFHLKEWTTGNQLVLERSGNFYGDKASLNTVVFHLLAGLPMNLYETGDIDVAELSSDYVDKATDPAGSFHTQLIITPELSFYYVGFNAAQPPFDDPNIRKAFAMSIDKNKLVSLVFENTLQKADGIVPPGINGSNASIKGTQFDPAGAKQLIKQSKYGDVSKLPEITLTTAGEGGAVTGWLGAAVYQWRENLGVEVKIRELEPNRYYYALKQEKDQLFDLGWIADYPHQQDFLEVLFATNSDVNYGGYSNPAVDSFLKQAGTEMDANQSIALYQQAEQMLIDDSACIPLWFGKSYMLVKPYVKGYQPSPLSFVFLNQVSIQK